MMGSYACVFSACRTYRYSLRVDLVPLLTKLRSVMFIGLNPSTADEVQLDPTLRRCVGFARSWGFDSMIMTNLFAFRATDPDVMRAAWDAVGPDNDTHLVRLARSARMVVCCWGVNGEHKRRNLEVETMLRVAGIALYCISRTKHGFPEHPLYLKKSLKPKPYRRGK